MNKKKYALLKTDHFLYCVVSILFYSFFIFQTKYLIDNDIYFHIKIADILRQKFILTKLPWMTYSIHAKRYVDYHFLFHYLLVPFIIIFKNLINSAKIATVIFCTFTIFSLSLLLKELKVKYRWFWILFYLLSSPIFTGRLLFARGVTLFIGIIFLFIFFLIKKKYIHGFIISLLSVWTYPGFPILLLFLSIYTLANLSSNSLDKEKIYFVVYAFLGLTTGIIINPSFPHQFYGYYLEFIVHSVRPTGLEAIAEWMPPDQIIIRVALIIPLMLFFIRFFKIEKHNEFESSLLIISIFIIVSLIASIKPLEYLIPFLTIYLALQNWDNYQKVFKYSCLFIILGSMIFWSLPQLYKRIKFVEKINSVEQDFNTADWLKNNTVKDSIIMLSWGDFPKFFYKNNYNRFLFGLNPVYCYGYDRKKYLMIKSFFLGNAVNIDDIPKLLDSKYAVLNKEIHARAIKLLEKNKVVYSNDKFVVYKFNN